MPQYEVVTSPGLQFPVGHVFETDALHPAMKQHVKLMRGKKVSVETEEGPEEEKQLVGPGYIDDPDAAFDMALEQAEKMKPQKEPVKPVVKPTKVKVPADGPGENS